MCDFKGRGIKCYKVQKVEKECNFGEFEKALLLTGILKEEEELVVDGDKAPMFKVIVKSE